MSFQSGCLATWSFYRLAAKWLLFGEEFRASWFHTNSLYEIIPLHAICKMLLKSLPQNIFTVCFSQFAIQGFGLIEINHIVIVSVFHFWNRWFPKYQRYFDIVLQNVALWVLVMLFISADILRNKTAPKFIGIRKIEKFWCKFVSNLY